MKLQIYCNICKLPSSNLHELLEYYEIYLPEILEIHSIKVPAQKNIFGENSKIAGKSIDKLA
jgi:hypothetical protein